MNRIRIMTGALTRNERCFIALAMYRSVRAQLLRDIEKIAVYFDKPGFESDIHRTVDQMRYWWNRYLTARRESRLKPGKVWTGMEFENDRRPQYDYNGCRWINPNV